MILKQNIIGKQDTLLSAKNFYIQVQKVSELRLYGCCHPFSFTNLFSVRKVNSYILAQDININLFYLKAWINNIIKFVLKRNQIFFSSMALKPFNIRWIKTGSETE